MPQMVTVFSSGLFSCPSLCHSHESSLVSHVIRVSCPSLCHSLLSESVSKAFSHVRVSGKSRCPSLLSESVSQAFPLVRVCATVTVTVTNLNW